MADFEIPFTIEKATIYEKMKTAVSQANGELNGTEESGSFLIPVAIGEIEGTFIILDESIKVEITKKPFLVSKKMIQETLEKFLQV